MKTTATKEEAKPALVPKLRFPEFREAEAWQYSPLGKLLMKSPDYGVNAAAVPFSEGLPQYLRITDISDDGTYLSAKKVSVDLAPTEEIFLDEEDIVLARTGASVGKSYRYRKEDGRLVFAGFLIRVRPNPKRLDSTYLANFLTTNQYWRWVAATSARSGQPGINSVEYGSLEIPLPAVFAEQQKIAECLSLVDELVAGQARKLAVLKTRKKGLMQQLFPREGETQPRLRFPEFQNKGEWEVEELSKCLKKVIDYRGKAPPKSESGVPLITAKNVRFGWLDMTNDEYIEEDKYEEWMSRGIPQAGDILFTTEAPLGNVALFPPEGKFALGQRLLTLRAKPDRCVPAFLFHSLLGPSMQEDIDFHGTGSTAKGIKSKVFVKLSFCHPGVQEQQRIASCLSSLDALITAETQKHGALKTHKKGLMQQLFPSPDTQPIST